MEKLKKSRAASFVVVAIVYVIAAAGIAAYRLMPFPFWLNLLLADVIATAVTFAFSLLFENASVYDPYWSVQPPVILTAYAAGVELNAGRALLLVAVWVWAIRLTANWAYTFRGLPFQDWRYTMLKEQTGRLYPFVNFFGIHLMPTLIVYGCTLPAVFAMQYEVTLNAWSVVFSGVSLLAVLLQGISDLQMHRFRKQGTGGFIRTGFWKYSRHPNYLGEILMWWGVALSALSMMPERWYLCAGALANTVMFFSVSIPLADGRQSRKEGFEQYKAETRMLLPIKK